MDLVKSMEVKGEHNHTEAKKYKWKQKLTPIGFISPVLLIFSLFLFFPVLFAFYMSFHQWGMIGTPEFVGFHNYVRLFQDPLFWTSIKNTLIFSLSVPLKVAIALFIAVLLNQKIRGLGFYRAAFFFPVVLSMVVVGLVWQWMFSPSYGFINYLLEKLGLPLQNMLIDSDQAMIVLIIVSIWKGLGSNLLLFLAGLQAIPSSVYEAAEIDGANSWQKFWHITVQLLKPTTLFVLIITLIGSFKIFDLAYVITGGGPGTSTMVLVHYIYQEAFQRFDMGYASAAAYVFFIILFILTLVQMRMFKSDSEF
ncbi:carbohydrate ABC transporter permease [Cytobacillus oceanisediminis]|uniref:Multiple sugar transport system permease protein n=1 Tax=Cytobacillus oceanisediminis TaxID=665099 RepID=A0A562J7J8_9BACI|nr:sugar ABC transporter permease [Cytobacillus oceanisediminis]TWH78894.1 multiple sugar transport system permease protein [Cytobacillus oceanisediminis]